MSTSAEPKDGHFVATVANLQEAEPVAPMWISRYEILAVRILQEIVTRSLQKHTLPRAVEVSLVDDETIARVHGEFMDDPTPTDVITFPYGEFGEILISVETARRQAALYERSFEAETALYLIHGILHLAGYTDHDDSGRDEMARLQEELLTQYL